MKVVPVKIRNVNVYPFQDMEELIDYTVDKKKLLLSLNAEIIMRAEGEVADIINSNVGYADGYGAVKAFTGMLRKLPAAGALAQTGKIQLTSTNFSVTIVRYKFCHKASAQPES